MKEKLLLVLGIVVILAVVGTLGVYMMSVPEMSMVDMAVPLIVVVIVGLAFWVLRDKAINMKKGLPAQDEMSKKIWHKSGYYAWIVTIYICLGASWVNEIMVDDFGFTGLIARHMAFVILGLSAITFFVFYFWFKWRGDT